MDDEPPHLILTPLTSQLTFPRCILDLSVLGLFSKYGAADMASALYHLAVLKPESIIPEHLEKWVNIYINLCPIVLCGALRFLCLFLWNFKRLHSSIEPVWY